MINIADLKHNMYMKLFKSPIKGRKLRAVFYKDKAMKDEIKSTDFGAKSYRDYTLMHQKKSSYYEPSSTERNKVKKLYQTRHKGDNLEDPTSAGALSWYVLWNKPTLKASVLDYKTQFKSEVEDVKILA